MPDDGPLTPRLGVSTCLLGEPVRMNGGHCRDAWLTEVLAPFVEWVPVCPEVEVGMGTPRPPLRLVAGGEEPRLVVTETGLDRTDEMTDWAAARLDELAAAAPGSAARRRDRGLL